VENFGHRLTAKLVITNQTHLTKLSPSTYHFPVESHKSSARLLKLLTSSVQSIS